MSGLSTFWEAVADLPHLLHYVQVGPWRTRVLEIEPVGPGGGAETVLLANGTSGHIEAWTQNVRSLAQAGFRVVGYDYPGHGYTTPTDHDLEIPEYEQHLLGLLDALGLDRVHLAGESLGGWLAVKFAAHHPERLHTVILSAPGGRVVGDQNVDRAQSVSALAVTEPTYANVKQATRGRDPRPEPHHRRARQRASGDLRPGSLRPEHGAHLGAPPARASLAQSGDR